MTCNTIVFCYGSRFHVTLHSSLGKLESKIEEVLLANMMAREKGYGLKFTLNNNAKYFFDWSFRGNDGSSALR
jgi:hypothetical protein